MNELPRNLKYSLRISNDDHNNKFKEIFVPIQNAIAYSYIELSGNVIKKTFDNIQLQRLPTPPHLDAKAAHLLGNWMHSGLVFSYLFIVINTVRYIVREKEKHLKMLMNIMGMPTSIIWTAWFLRSIIYMTILNALIVGVLKVFFILKNIFFWSTIVLYFNFFLDFIECPMVGTSDISIFM